MSILNQSNIGSQAIISNGFVTGNQVQNPDNLLNTTNSTAIFGATSDVILGNFPFNIPLNAVIVGIKGIVKARIDNSSIPAGSLTPVLVDASSGSNQYFPGVDVVGLSNVLQEYEIGGEYDAWGNAWTPVTINNLRLQLVANSALEVAWATLTVFYYIPVVTPAPSPFDLPGCEDCDSEIQALPFELKRVWRTNETVLLLKSFNLPNGTPITMDMLGECGGTINLTIDPDLRKEDGGNFIENFNLLSSIAAITITSEGVELDIGNISQRGLGFDTPYGHNIYNISEHAVGAVVIITNNGPYNSKLLKRCHVGTVVSAPIEVQDEGTTVAISVDKFNFRGSDVQASQDASDPYKVNIDFLTDPTNNEAVPGSTSEGSTGTTPASSLTIPHTIGADENYLRVWISTQDVAISGVTYNSVAMTSVASETNSPADLKGALYELINPTVGLHDIVISVGSPAVISGGGIGYENVDTVNPTADISTGNSGSDDAPTDSITTTVDNIVLQDVVATKTNPTTFTQYGLWTIQSQINASSRPGASSTRKVLVPQLVNDQYGLSATMDWVIILAGVRGATATPPNGVQSVTSSDAIIPVDNTDPANPVIGPIDIDLLSEALSGTVSVLADGVTITGTGVTGDPLVAVGGGGGSTIFAYSTVSHGTSSTSYATLDTIVIPANTLASGKVMRLTLVAPSSSGSNNGNFDYQILLGSTGTNIHFDVGSSTFSVFGQNGLFVQSTILCDGTDQVHTMFGQGQLTSGTTKGNGNGFATGTENLTTSLNLVIQAKCSVGINQSVGIGGYIVEIIG